ncbi:hypothetical protein B0J18DRAFT_203400 [Chaetomium sp. MPI-SDFR-AT-0129]|nr:hypothetical protein B0J18DRAFT_203400 [Chaetomium sp. MPI-SDFR-AT-0129]
MVQLALSQKLAGLLCLLGGSRLMYLSGCTSLHRRHRQLTLGGVKGTTRTSGQRERNRERKAGRLRVRCGLDQQKLDLLCGPSSSPQRSFVGLCQPRIALSQDTTSPAARSLSGTFALSCCPSWQGQGWLWAAVFGRLSRASYCHRPTVTSNNERLAAIGFERGGMIISEIWGSVSRPRAAWYSKILEAK